MSHKKSGLLWNSLPQQSCCFVKPLSVGHVRQKSDLTGALDGLGELTLMMSAGTGSATRQDLAAFGQETAKLRSVLIIDRLALINAELANLSALMILLILIKSHGLVLLLSEW